MNNPLGDPMSTVCPSRCRVLRFRDLGRHPLAVSWCTRLGMPRAQQGCIFLFKGESYAPSVILQVPASNHTDPVPNVSGFRACELYQKRRAGPGGWVLALEALAKLDLEARYTLRHVRRPRPAKASCVKLGAPKIGPGKGGGQRKRDAPTKGHLQPWL